MARKRKETVEASAKSPEFLAFENLAKQVIGIPKAELDRREAEEKKAKGK